MFSQILSIALTSCMLTGGATLATEEPTTDYSSYNIVTLSDSSYTEIESDVLTLDDGMVLQEIDFYSDDTIDNNGEIDNTDSSDMTSQENKDKKASMADKLASFMAGIAEKKEVLDEKLATMKQDMVNKKAEMSEKLEEIKVGLEEKRIEMSNKMSDIKAGLENKRADNENRTTGIGKAE